MKLHTILEGKLYQRGRFHHIQLADKLATLRQHGIDVVVNLWRVPDTELAPHLYAYIHQPLRESRADIPRALALSEQVARLIADGHGVLVHCYAGRNRSGFLSALVVMRLLGVDGETAIRIVRQGRPNAIDERRGGFYVYMRALKELDGRDAARYTNTPGASF